MDQQTIIYISAAIGVAVILMYNSNAFGSYSFITLGLSLASIVFVFLINYADFLLFPLLTYLLKIRIVPAKGYYIPRNSNSILKVSNGIYYATGYLTANVYNYVFTVEAVDETEEGRLSEGPDKWERIVMSAGFPFRYNIISVAEDIQKFREELEGKRGEIEFQMSKEMNSEKPDEIVIQDLQRKMNVVDARIGRLSGGERPLKALMYIETTAVGVSEKEAVDALTNQLNHLETLFNSFDLSITRVMGRELYYLFSFNYSLPEKELLSQVFSTQA